MRFRQLEQKLGEKWAELITEFVIKRYLGRLPEALICFCIDVYKVFFISTIGQKMKIKKWVEEAFKARSDKSDKINP